MLAAVLAFSFFDIFVNVSSTAFVFSVFSVFRGHRVIVKWSNSVTFLTSETFLTSGDDDRGLPRETKYKKYRKYNFSISFHVFLVFCVSRRHRVTVMWSIWMKFVIPQRGQTPMTGWRPSALKVAAERPQISNILKETSMCGSFFSPVVRCQILGQK